MYAYEFRLLVPFLGRIHTAHLFGRIQIGTGYMEIIG